MWSLCGLVVARQIVAFIDIFTIKKRRKRPIYEWIVYFPRNLLEFTVSSILTFLRATNFSSTCSFLYLQLWFGLWFSISLQESAVLGERSARHISLPYLLCGVFWWVHHCPLIWGTSTMFVQFWLERTMKFRWYEEYLRVEKAKLFKFTERNESYMLSTLPVRKSI